MANIFVTEDDREDWKTAMETTMAAYIIPKFHELSSKVAKIHRVHIIKAPLNFAL